MEPATRRCMICGKTLELQGGICVPCQERIRREALGECESRRAQNEKDLRKHGVTPQAEKR